MGEESIFGNPLGKIRKAATRALDTITEPGKDKPEQEIDPERRKFLGVAGATIAAGPSKVAEQMAGAVLPSAATVAQTLAAGKGAVEVGKSVYDASAVLKANVPEALYGLGNIREAIKFNRPSYRTGQTIKELFETASPIDPSTGKFSSHSLSQLRYFGTKYLPDSIKIKDIMDPEILNKSFGDVRPEWFAKRGTTPGEYYRDTGKLIQELTGLDEEATMADVKMKVQEKITEIAKNALNRPELLPDTLGGKRAFYEELEQSMVENGIKRDDPLRKKIDDLERQTRKAIELEHERTAPERERETIAESNSNLEKRSPKEILCEIRTELSKPDDLPGSVVFLIKPKEEPLNGLTRMHIELLRQREFPDSAQIPGDTRVENVGKYLRVATTDKKLQNYFLKFVDDKDRSYDTMLKIPNRLQNEKRPVQYEPRKGR